MDRQTDRRTEVQPDSKGGGGAVGWQCVLQWTIVWQISTLEILNVEPGDSTLSDDQVFAMRQAARHVCGALKKYFEAHLVVKAEEVRRSHIRSDGSSPLQETPAYKVRGRFLGGVLWTQKIGFPLLMSFPRSRQGEGVFFFVGYCGHRR